MNVSQSTNSSCLLPTDCMILERLQACDCVVYAAETPGMCWLGPLFNAGSVSVADWALLQYAVCGILLIILTVRIWQLYRDRFG